MGALVATTATASANTSTAFPAGSLIIPTSSAFQDDCGAVSAYGLIYDVLRANTWLAANGYGKITIYYAFLDTKASPNRCVPTSLHTGSYPAGAPTVTAPYTTAMWNDGCDITGVKAQLIVNSDHTAALQTITTFDNSSKSNVYPAYSSKTATATDTVNYMGGPFVILAQDANTFRGLLDGTLVSKVDNVTHAKDVNGNVIDFSPFRTKGGGQGSPPTSSCTLGTDHYVYVHRATNTFIANIGKAFQSTPPRLALLATDVNNHTGTVSNNILQAYLTNSGLNYTGASGCPTGSANTACTSSTGQIFDSFDFDDLATKLDTAKYNMLWTPHWETNLLRNCVITGGTGACACYTGCTTCTKASGTGSCVVSAYTGPSAAETTALSTVKTFLDGQTGLAAECASISSYEGAYTASSAVDSYAGMQLQTCVNSGSGTCSASTTPYGVTRNPTSVYGSSTNAGDHTILRNCSDPNLTSGTCAYFPYPGDSFVQIGDYKWDANGGYITGYIPLGTTSSIYQKGVVPLIGAVSDLASGNSTLHTTPGSYDSANFIRATTDTNAHAYITAELVSRSVKDATTGKANVLYLGGHNQSTATNGVAGTKLMMETLLQLGISTLPPITSTTEVSRSSPIPATVGNAAAIVQGTYGYVTPTPSPTSYSTTADSSTFRFPAIKGHLRARTVASISTTGSTFGSSGVLFDAGGAGSIPDPTPTGCGTWFTSSCRTVFTTLVTGANPAVVYVTDTSTSTTAGTVGYAMAGFGANPLGTPDQSLLIDRILAGDDSLVPGFFQPALGGIDRSTVAVIGSSSLVNGNRPQMAYVGATDGMMHAICAEVKGQCLALGQELWAYIPRTNLSQMRYNNARIDGSPLVVDAFGDFSGSGKRGWHTILMFQTGWGDMTGTDRVPAVYAMDVSDPTNPSVAWEYSVTTPSTPGTFALGAGLHLAAGRVQTGTNPNYYVFAQTNNGGTSTNGNVVTAIDVEKGTKVWQTGYQFTTALRTGGASLPSVTAMPGGVAAVDKQGQGYVTDIVFGTLYGDVWELDPVDGTSRYTPNKPLFRYTTDYHAFGAQPALYSKGALGQQYAAFVTGGYTETYGFDTSWTTAGVTNQVIGMSLQPASATPINENTGAPDIDIKFDLGANERGYSQISIIGSQIFVSSDSSDGNNVAYGTSGATGHVYRYDFVSKTAGAMVVVEGGLGSVVNNGTDLYVGSSDQTQQLGTGATAATGNSTDTVGGTAVSRKLWLRTQ